MKLSSGTAQHIVHGQESITLYVFFLNFFRRIQATQGPPLLATPVPPQALHIGSLDRFSPGRGFAGTFGMLKTPIKVSYPFVGIPGLFKPKAPAWALDRG